MQLMIAVKSIKPQFRGERDLPLNAVILNSVKVDEILKIIYRWKASTKNANPGGNHTRISNAEERKSCVTKAGAHKFRVQFRFPCMASLKNLRIPKKVDRG